MAGLRRRGAGAGSLSRRRGRTSARRSRRRQRRFARPNAGRREPLDHGDVGVLAGGDGAVGEGRDRAGVGGVLFVGREETFAFVAVLGVRVLGGEQAGARGADDADRAAAAVEDVFELRRLGEVADEEHGEVEPFGQGGQGREDAADFLVLPGVDGAEVCGQGVDADQGESVDPLGDVLQYREVGRESEEVGRIAGLAADRAQSRDHLWIASRGVEARAVTLSSGSSAERSSVRQGPPQGSPSGQD